MKGNKNRLRIGIDWDDTLAVCIEAAVEKARKDGYGVLVSDVTGWMPLGTKADVIMNYFTPELFRDQKMMPGAVEFVRELTNYGEVFIISAVSADVMSLRAEQITKTLPFIPFSNIILGKRKDMVDVDILIDDSKTNILDSHADFPILYRQPWNQDVSGILSGHSYSEILFIVKMIALGMPEPVGMNHLIALVGPSGSGKTEVIEALCKKGASRVPSYTDSPSGKKNDIEVSPELYDSLLENGSFIERTVYAGRRYGTTKQLVKMTFPLGVIAVDICGAMALKKEIPETVVVYIDRTRCEMVREIINDERYSVDEKTIRIVSMDVEKRNRLLCDYWVKNKDPEETADKILDLIGKI